MEELSGDDVHMPMAIRIVRIIAYDAEKQYVSQKVGQEVLHPVMSKYNISARIEINSKWFDKVDTNKDLKIDCNELCTYLKKIKFNESKNFLTDLEQAFEKYKQENGNEEQSPPVISPMDQLVYIMDPKKEEMKVGQINPQD